MHKNRKIEREQVLVAISMVIRGSRLAHELDEARMVIAASASHSATANEQCTCTHRGTAVTHATQARALRGELQVTVRSIGPTVSRQARKKLAPLGQITF